MKGEQNFSVTKEENKYWGIKLSGDQNERLGDRRINDSRVKLHFGND